MDKYARRWLVGFAKAVRLDDWYAHWDLVDSLSNSVAGEIIWC